MASECTALHEMPRRVLKGCCKFAAAKGEGVYELLILLTGSLLGIFLYPTHPLLLYKHGHIENAFRSSVFGEEMKGFFLLSSRGDWSRVMMVSDSWGSREKYSHIQRRLREFWSKVIQGLHLHEAIKNLFAYISTKILRTNKLRR